MKVPEAGSDVPGVLAGFKNNPSKIVGSEDTVDIKLVLQAI